MAADNFSECSITNSSSDGQFSDGNSSNDQSFYENKEQMSYTNGRTETGRGTWGKVNQTILDYKITMKEGENGNGMGRFNLAQVHS